MRDFNHTVNVLVKAYFNNTLEHGFCTACAVGNIVADAINDRPKERKGTFHKMFVNESLKRFMIGKFLYDEYEHSTAVWQAVFKTRYHGGTQTVRPERYTGVVKGQIDATGYTWQELARVESAFENAERGEDAYSWMFNGLMEVVDVLADIHGIDLTQREEAKLLFVKDN